MYTTSKLFDKVPVHHTEEQKQQIQDMQRMVSELKKHLKQQSKNNLIAMVTNNLIEIHNLKTQLSLYSQQNPNGVPSV